MSGVPKSGPQPLRNPDPERNFVFFLSFEGVWAVHTTVIRAADQREVGNLVRIRAPKSTDAGNFAEMLRFPTLLSETRFRCKVFHQKFEKTCCHCSGRLVCVEMIASETPERRRSTFLKNVCFCALVRLDYTHFCKKTHVVCALVRLDYTCLHVALVLHWPAFQQHRLLWCFTGYYFVDDKRSHAAWRSSCAPDFTLFRCYLLTFKLAWLMWMAVLALLLWCFTGYHFTHFWCCGVSLATISLTTSAPMLRGARRPRS